jgi:hypothetical protein
MTRFLHQTFPVLVVGFLFLIESSIQDQSVYDMSGIGSEFVPIDNSLPPLLTFPAKNLIYCSLECNKRTDCRVFDFDAHSQQCRLWDADLTTGSIVLSSSKPQSSVGTIQLSPSIYANVHNQSCDVNSSTCQCPSETFWNSSMCLSQLFQNQTCSLADACRSDLNLTCQPSCDFTYRCPVRKSIEFCFYLRIPCLPSVLIYIVTIYRLKQYSTSPRLT